MAKIEFVSPNRFKSICLKSSHPDPHTELFLSAFDGLGHPKIEPKSLQGRSWSRSWATRSTTLNTCRAPAKYMWGSCRIHVGVMSDKCRGHVAQSPFWACFPANMCSKSLPKRPQNRCSNLLLDYDDSSFRNTF